MKSARENMDMIATYFDVGSYRGAAEICGTTHKTVKRAVARQLGPEQARGERARNYDVVTELVTKRVGSTRARISAKRLLPEARAGGYTGSARNFRRLVARRRTTGGPTTTGADGRGCGRRARR